MKDYVLLARRNQQCARDVLRELRLLEFWEDNGCRVNVIGSLSMGLLVKHLDIDLHVYSSDLTEERSFEIVSKLAKNPRIKELRCINGLFTDEHCIAWHLIYEARDNRLWQLDIIHIEAGTQYDGFFERQAKRIGDLMSDEQRDAILRLKYETAEGVEIHGVEYYQAVIEDGVRTLSDLLEWVKVHRKRGGSYWMP